MDLINIEKSIIIYFNNFCFVNSHYYSKTSGYSLYIKSKKGSGEKNTT